MTVTTTVEASAPADPAPETSKTSEVVETSLASSDETAVGPNDESGVIDVTVVGDQGSSPCSTPATPPTVVPVPLTTRS